MENEIMNNEELNVEEVNLEEDVIVVCEDPEEEEGGALGLILLGAAAVVGIGAFVLKRIGKIDEWRIKCLQKKGYVVLKPEEVEAQETVDCCDAVEEDDK